MTLSIYCELAIEASGFAFLPGSLTLRKDAQQMSTPSSRTKKTFFSSCKKCWSQRVLHPHSATSQVLQLSDFPLTTSLVAPNHSTSTWKSKSSLGSFRYQPPKIRITKASNLTDTRSTLKTVPQIPTPWAATVIRDRTAREKRKKKVWQWTGGPRPFQSKPWSHDAKQVLHIDRTCVASCDQGFDWNGLGPPVQTLITW